MHSAKHACDEPVDTPALLDQGYESRDSAFVIRRMSEVREDHLLERIDLVLQVHEVGDRLVPVNRQLDARH